MASNRHPRSFVILTGGGTAGHVLPALEVARELITQGCPIESIIYVGTQRGVGIELVEAEGISCVAMAGRGLSGHNPLNYLLAVLALSKALIKACRLMINRRPRITFSTGGYGGMAIGLASVIFRVPLVVFEPNAKAGRTNKVLARLASKNAVSFLECGLPNSIETGTPVRKEVLRWSPLFQPEDLTEHNQSEDQLESKPSEDQLEPSGIYESSAKKLKQSARHIQKIGPDVFQLFAFGGSLGSRRINVSIAQLIEIVANKMSDSSGSKLSIRHAVGERDWDEFRSKVLDKPLGLSTVIDELDCFELSGANFIYHALRYERNMDVALASADLVIGRSGALTIAELCVIGKPSILVPLPNSPGDHQLANARILSDAGAAIIIEDSNLDGAELWKVVEKLSKDKITLEKMCNSAIRLAKPQATQQITKLLYDLAK